MRRRAVLRLSSSLILLGLLTMTGWAQLAVPAAAQQDEAATARDALRPWAQRIDSAVARLNAGDGASAQADFNAFDTVWLDIEDDIRAVSRVHYREIERAMGDARAGFAARPIDPAAVSVALRRLQAVNASFLAGAPVPDQGATTEATPSTPTMENPTPATLLALLDSTLAAIDRGDVQAARGDLRSFQTVWLDVEGLVKARSPALYTSTENRTAQLAAQLNGTPPDLGTARATALAMRSDLAAVVDAGSRYSAWDAAIILLREGLEALLVIAALVAFLQRSGNADKQRWIWGGGLAGIVASLVVAALAQVVLARAAANVGREMIEGVTGLVAAAMLLYMGYWLHSKASLAGWQTYIQTQSTAALNRNNLLGLSLIAFLAVFREGAETVLFYVGIASSISLSDLALGLGIGAVGLAVMGVLMLVVGVRLPIRPFFLVATVLIYYLCLKFVGMGVHSFQVAGLVPATPAPYLPSWDALGMFPTWETTLAQLVVLAIILAATLLPRLQARGTPAAARASQQ